MSVIDLIDFTPTQFEEQTNVYGNESESITNSFQNHNIENAVAVQKEILINPSKTLMSKTNRQGIIEYANDYFVEISGYQEYELMGKPHNIVRHPDMPKTIFKILWEHLEQGENIHVIIKNKNKEGKYYWIITDFDFKKDENGNIISYYSYRKAVPKNIINKVEDLYKTLKVIEETKSEDLAYSYLKGMLEEKNISFIALTLSFLDITPATLNQYFNKK